MSVCPSVSLPKSAVTFDLLDGPAQNFHGPLTSFASNFWGCDLDLGPYPEKGGFHQIFLLLKVLGQGGVMSYLLGKRGRKAELARGATKILEFQHLIQRDTSP